MFQDWIWPLARHPTDGRLPAVSDGFSRSSRGGAGHYGVDIMFKREAAGEVDLPEFTTWFEMPTDRVDALAPGPGFVNAVNKLDPHGVSIEVVHDESGYTTAYRHLARAYVRAGQRVVTGTPLGRVGFDRAMPPEKTPNHLHFELWDTRVVASPGQTERRKSYGIDPIALLRRATIRGSAGGNDTDLAGPHDLWLGAGTGESSRVAGAMTGAELMTPPKKT